VTEEKEKDSHIFGPVPSRRLGRSLGVDLVPFKTCTYDCIYCQLGPTTCKTLERKEWIPTEELIKQVRDIIPRSRPDYVTLSGSGEPTLHSEIGKIIDEIKSTTDIPLAVLTNGSLLWDPDVRDAVLNADLLIPSLDAGTEERWLEVNVPHEDLSFEQMVGGLLDLRKHYRGEVWLEIFLLAGLTATEDEVDEMIKLTRKMNFDRIQLNTVTRPPSKSSALPVPSDQMLRYSARFGPGAEVIADYQSVHDMPSFAAGREDVLEMLRHRPCTLDDIAGGLRMHRNEAVKYVEELMSRNEISIKEQNGRKYYVTRSG